MIGTILNRKYQIKELIGTGGMAEVYRAVDLGRQRTVAVKILKEEFRSNPEFLRRFEREARTVLHLSQENIVRAYGVGEYNGIPYIVLEYVEGKTLKEHLQEKGTLPQKSAVGSCVQILSALSAAHEAGIIHRDVKPQNIIVTPSGKMKLTDFGIARDVQANTVTFDASNVLGSAHYLSPEQAKGEPVSEESDLYSLGIVLYEMLTGTVPFSGDTAVSIALMQINDEPVPAIERNPEIYPSVNAVLMRALKKDPGERYRTAEKMKRALLYALKHPDFIPDSEHPGPSDDADEEEESEGFSIHTIPPAWKIGIVIAGLILAFIGTFFGVQAIFRSDGDQLGLVPALAGKELQEATARAEDYGFTVDISEYEINEDFASGVVITQSPEAGQKAKPGSAITVTVSSGPSVPVIPDIIGKTMEEATEALTAAGFAVGTVSYQVSDTAIGYICSQYPSAGAEFPAGTPVNISISATKTSSFEMPSVILFPLKQALPLLEQSGSMKIRLQYDTTVTDDKNYGVIIQQSPGAGNQVQSNSTVLLTVGGPQPAGYSADTAFSVDIAENGTPVLAVIEDAPYGYLIERVLYSGTLERGEKIPIPVTATVSSSGIYEIILYINGVEAKRQEITFNETNQIP